VNFTFAHCAMPLTLRNNKLRFMQSNQRRFHVFRRSRWDVRTTTRIDTISCGDIMHLCGKSKQCNARVRRIGSNE
jgi:hypothetical protein